MADDTSMHRTMRVRHLVAASIAARNRWPVPPTLRSTHAQKR